MCYMTSHVNSDQRYKSISSAFNFTFALVIRAYLVRGTLPEARMPVFGRPGRVTGTITALQANATR